MSYDIKDAVRLLMECCDELRLHDENPGHKTRSDLKLRIGAFMSGLVLDTPEKAADVLTLSL